MITEIPRLTIRRGSTSIEITPPLIAAPMAGAIDHPYRTLLHTRGCRLSFTEMISSRGLHEDSRRTMELIGSIQPTGFTGAQIFGSDPVYLKSGSKKVQDHGFHLIDLNSGCPKRKVMSQGSGGALLKNTGKLIKCLSTIVECTTVPVGIKIRSAYHHFDGAKFRRMIAEIEGAGASYLSIHPRTVVQGFSGRADRDVISIASDLLSIPIIASGDVKHVNDVMDYLDRGASGVMIGRSLLGDPSWFDRNAKAMISGSGELSDPDIAENLALARDHLRLNIDHYGEKRGVIKFRTHLGWYLKRFQGRSDFRDRIYSVKREEDISLLLSGIESLLR
jgi:tRNA-dihydrouridine synthase B